LQIFYFAVKLLFCTGVEFDPTQPPRLNERVLKDKRKKLRETFDRVINMYVSEFVCHVSSSDFLLVSILVITVALSTFSFMCKPSYSLKAAWFTACEMVCFAQSWCWA